MEREAMTNADKVTQAALVLVEEALFSNGSYAPPAAGKIMLPDANGQVKIDSSQQYVSSGRGKEQVYSGSRDFYLDDRQAFNRIQDSSGQTVQTIEEHYHANILRPGSTPYQALMVVRGPNGDIQYELRGRNSSCASSSGMMNPCRREYLNQDFRVYDNLGRQLPVQVHLSGSETTDNRLQLSAKIIREQKNGNSGLPDLVVVGEVTATLGLDPTQAQPDHAILQFQKQGIMLGQIEERGSDSTVDLPGWNTSKPTDTPTDKPAEKPGESSRPPQATGKDDKHSTTPEQKDEIRKREEEERLKRLEAEKKRYEEERQKRLEEERKKHEEKLAKAKACLEAGKGPDHGCPIY